MPTRCRVVLYGDSLVLAGVGLGLARYPRLEVIVLDPSSENASQQLRSLRPAVVILDLSTVTPDADYALTSDHPDLLLIGLDPGGDRIVVVSGQQARCLSTKDLVRLIETGVPMAKSMNGSEDSYVF